MFLQLVIACHSKTSRDRANLDAVPEFRKNIKELAIAEYKEKVDNPINDWYFSVRLFETPKTFQYLLRCSLKR